MTDFSYHAAATKLLLSSTAMKKIDFHIHTKTSILDENFEFSHSKLDEYIEVAGLDGIAITNHNLFDKAQFVAIRDHINIPVYPGIEVDLGKGQMLVISNGVALDDFDAACTQVASMCRDVGDSISVDEFKRIFGDLEGYILIPHYEKKPSIDNDTLNSLSPFVTAGEVSSPKKFVYCIKSEERLVPVYFSDCRIRSDLSPLPVRQTFVDCSEASFSAVKECLRDKNKVALSKEDGNELFQVFENGQQLSTGLNVVLGDRSSGKSYTLEAIKKQFPGAYYIRQFALVARDEDEDEKRFNAYLSQKQGLFSKDYLSDLQRVIEDVLDIDLDRDARDVGQYVSTLLEFAKETEKHDSFSKAKIYSEDPFPDRNQKGLEELIASTKNLISNVEFKEIVEKHLERTKLVSLYIDLMGIYSEREEVRLKKIWINELVQNIKGQLQLRSAAPKIADVDLYTVALNKRKVEKFVTVAKLARSRRTPLRKEKRGFAVVAEVGPFAGAGELKAAIARKLSFSKAFDAYENPYKFLQELKGVGAPLMPADFSKCFVKIAYRILNKDGFEASGGERSEFFLLDEIEGANEHDMLLIDEPESSFDNNFLKADVNVIIKEMSRKMPVVVITHNNTVGASIKPDYLLCTKKELEDRKVSWRIYSGYPTSKVLTSPDGKTVSTWNVMMGSLEAGSAAYEERRRSYENLKN
ncbi:histidinol-phosphatase [Rhizobium sp. CNPSo 4039]|uniref:histidinol-phosphatase n=1 Tax=Rhizobium sp. CNPSo 4039 TaxID=3021409 RepID=UPI00254F04BE|nr:histidinol-phosphatase [Rhizobium sp. CNPSo 4039]MDK4714680.1 histidinol-phosphatase [Rhizobium sp. CNPSo 4039]